jgi:hypothetical protein
LVLVLVKEVRHVIVLENTLTLLQSNSPNSRFNTTDYRHVGFYVLKDIFNMTYVFSYQVNQTKEVPVLQVVDESLTFKMFNFV